VQKCNKVNSIKVILEVPDPEDEGTMILQNVKKPLAK
jgi:hypothetical protein